MTSTMYLETVSLTDDASDPSSAPSNAAVLDMDRLEHPFASSSESDAPASLVSSQDVVVPVSESAINEDGHGPLHQATKDRETTNSVVVEVHDETTHVPSQSRTQHETLPPLQLLPPTNVPVDEDAQDYVDPNLFSPDVSRHAMEIAHRRAKAIANEVKEMMELEGMDVYKAGKTKLSPAEAVGIIGGAFASSFQRAKKLVKPGTKEYDLLSGTSPSSAKVDDLDTDGDGLQLSPDASSHTDGKLFGARKLKPALKRISAYSTTAALESEKKTAGPRPAKKKTIVWHQDVLDADEEFYDDESGGQETSALMHGDGNVPRNGNGSPRPHLLDYSNKSDTGPTASPSRKKRKKLVRSMMRRLTPREKEELYRQRPDLMIVPNWAQKYREELAGEDPPVCNAWLFGFVLVLVMVLLAFLVLLVRHRATTTSP